jgi:hypothetical protein
MNNNWFFHIELPVLDSWRTIEVLRTTILNCLSTVFESESYCETLGMIVAELLENALKYGKRKGSPSCATPFWLKITGMDEAVEIAVSNPIDRDNPNVQRLFDLVEQLGASGSPERVYLERLRAVASDSQATGGLGLTRIAYESGCTVRAELSAEDVLQVKVFAPLGTRLPAAEAPSMV